MTRTLWIIIVVISGFLGFTMGYSFPPFLQTDLSSGKLQIKPEAQQVDKKMQDYYKNLYKENE